MIKHYFLMHQLKYSQLLYIVDRIWNTKLIVKTFNFSHSFKSTCVNEYLCGLNLIISIFKSYKATQHKCVMLSDCKLITILHHMEIS